MFPAYLATFTEEILNEKPNILCSEWRTISQIAKELSHNILIIFIFAFEFLV